MVSGYEWADLGGWRARCHLAPRKVCATPGRYTERTGMAINTICATCGTTLHSELSRTLGRCGACRAGEETGGDYPSPPPDLRRRVPGATAPDPKCEANRP